LRSLWMRCGRGDACRMRPYHEKTSQKPVCEGTGLVRRGIAGSAATAPHPRPVNCGTGSANPSYADCTRRRTELTLPPSATLPVARPELSSRVGETATWTSPTTALPARSCRRCRQCSWKSAPARPWSKRGDPPTRRARPHRQRRLVAPRGGVRPATRISILMPRHLASG
jgi:hypothetical protein